MAITWKWKIFKTSIKEKEIANEKENDLPTSVFLCSKLFFQPNDANEETWACYSDAEKLNLMEACEGRFLISGEHRIRCYYELSNGLIFVITEDSFYRCSITLKQMDEALLQQNNIIFIKT